MGISWRPLGYANGYHGALPALLAAPATFGVAYPGRPGYAARNQPALDAIGQATGVPP